MPVVVQSIPRATDEVIARLGQAGFASVHKVQGGVGLMSAKMRPIQQDLGAARPAVTSNAPPSDNWMIHLAIKQLQEGIS